MTPASLFQEWLGADGTRPPPLDRFLSRRRPPEPVVHGVDRLVRRAVALVAAPASGGSALCSQLRRLAPGDLERAALPALPSSIRERRARAGTWPERCAAWGIPPGFAPLLERRAATWGESRASSWLEAQDGRPPLWVRLRSPTAAAELRALGFTVHEEGSAARVAGRGDPRVAMRGGGFEIQDRASQAVASLASLRPGQRAWDVCAGRGGKAMAMADGLQGRGAVVATDVDEGAVADLKVRARRAGVAGVVRARAWDGETIPDFGPEARRGFDVVLVDAPCSASGTWRRNPDARLRTDPSEVPGFATLQRRLLSLAAERVAPKGRLVYATCSVFLEEDEDVGPGPGWSRVEGGLVGAPDWDSDTLFGAAWVRG